MNVFKHYSDTFLETIAEFYDFAAFSLFLSFDHARIRLHTETLTKTSVKAVGDKCLRQLGQHLSPTAFTGVFVRVSVHSLISFRFNILMFAIPHLPSPLQEA